MWNSMNISFRKLTFKDIFDNSKSTQKQSKLYATVESSKKSKTLISFFLFC